MANLRASVITAATIRVAGQVHTDISISHLGTPEQEASLRRIGELLIYVRTRTSPTGSPSCGPRLGPGSSRCRRWPGSAGYTCQ